MMKMEYDTIVIKSQRIIEDCQKEIQSLLTGIPYKCEYRIKSEEHILRKVQKENLEKITDAEDIVGLRIMLETEEVCHKVYSLLTNYFHPYKISDYFAKPKATGFKAYLLKLNNYEINTEIQIMTHDMKIITEDTHQIHEDLKYNN